MKKIIIYTITAFVCFSLSDINAQQPIKPADWGSYNFLIGEWIGDGSGAPGQGSGSFTFSFDLQKRVLIRKGYTDFPKAGDKPAFRHDDLMIVYQENDKTKAVYWDNEGHAINYLVEFSQDKNKLYFTSEIVPSSPRFRLIYEKLSDGRINNIFEIAMPGKPDQFNKYIEGIVKKK